MAFFNVVVICDWPTTVLKFCGRYFLAETMNLSIIVASIKFRISNWIIEFVYSLLTNFLFWIFCEDIFNGNFFVPEEHLVGRKMVNRLARSVGTIGA